MAKDDKYFLKNEDDQYGGGVLLDEYHGNYSLVSAREGNNGEIYMQWVFPQGPDRKPRDKGVPWKVSFGDKEATVKALQYFLSILEAGVEAPF